jgi:hypothetical protein
LLQRCLADGAAAEPPREELERHPESAYSSTTFPG